MRKSFSISGGAVCSADGASQDVYKASKRACEQYKVDRHQELLNDPELIKARKTIFLAYNKSKVDTVSNKLSNSEIASRYKEVKVCGEWVSIRKFLSGLAMMMYELNYQFR